MNIKILDSWLREHIKTKATPEKIAEILSLTSVSVERIDKIDNDFVYDIEVTTNRPDVMSVIGLARETAASLQQSGIDATYIPYLPKTTTEKVKNTAKIIIKNDPKLVNRICAVIMEVDIKTSPEIITKRLEASGIRSLNNLIDITNYVMLEIGHPTHVFDYDRLLNHTLIIRESKKGEKITTLDQKTHTLLGGDIVADNGQGEIIDLLGIMGTANSVVTDNTKRILFFIDNNDPVRIRKTSMSLGIRTDAAVINEKNIDPTLTMTTLLRGIELYNKTANGKIISNIIDIYPKKQASRKITVTLKKIQTLLGIEINLPTVIQILKSLEFVVTKKNNDTLIVSVPSFRSHDVTIEEDICEEVARLYGYHKLPCFLPPLTQVEYHNVEKNNFYWEERIKNTFKYWGFTEMYTYSLVSENLFEGPIENAVTLSNPLIEDMLYLRRTLVPSLLQVVRENKNRDTIAIFEIANIYEKTDDKNLPNEIPMLAGVIKKNDISFFDVKGILEQLFTDIGIKNIHFKKEEDIDEKIDIYCNNSIIGEVEMLESNLIDFEINFVKMIKHATLKKVYTPASKYPPIIEDIAFVFDKPIIVGDVITLIKKQDAIIKDASLLDTYEDTKTFHVIFQHNERNLTAEDVTPIRNKIITAVKDTFKARIKV